MHWDRVDGLKKVRGGNKRFGIPTNFRRVVKTVYSYRGFQVRVDGQMSSRCQEHGMAQSCPLSPFLFSLLMTVLLFDANMDLRSRGGLILPQPW